MGPKLIEMLKNICQFGCHINVYAVVSLFIIILVIEAFLAFMNTHVIKIGFL